MIVIDQLNGQEKGGGGGFQTWSPYSSIIAIQPYNSIISPIAPVAEPNPLEMQYPCRVLDEPKMDNAAMARIA